MDSSLARKQTAPLVVLPNGKRADGPTNADLLADDEEFVMRPWTGAGEPLPIVEASGSHVWDADGKRYLDFTSGYFVNQAGHSHPTVIAAAIEQLQRVSQVSGRHATEASVGLARELAAIAPGTLKKTLFTTGGNEATEFAIKMARQASGKQGIAFLENSFHGLSVTALAACTNASYRSSASTALDESFVAVPAPYCYRCPHASNCATQCVDALEQALDANPEVGTLLAEPMQAVGGVIPPARWWKRVDEVLEQRGLLLILDEIQTGLGRTGALFGAEHYGLEPDIMTLAKGLSGGVGSLGAVMATPAVADAFWGATSPTSAANAVSCAAGRALLQVIQDDGLVDNATRMGAYMSAAIAARDIPWIGDIRFQGLLGGVELVYDRVTKTPISKQHILAIKSDLLERGVIVTATGPLGNVLRIQPPLSVSKGEIDEFVLNLDAAIRSAAQTVDGPTTQE